MSSFATVLRSLWFKVSLMVFYVLPTRACTPEIFALGHWAKRSSRRLTEILCVLVCFFINSCTNHWQEEKRYGVFVERTSMERDNLDWEGGNESATKRIVCSTISDWCTDGPMDGLLDSPGRAVIILSDDEYRMFDKNTGDPIVCLNCGDVTLNDVLARQYIFAPGVHWSSDGSAGYVINNSPGVTYIGDKRMGDNAYYLWLLKVSNNGIYLRLLIPETPSYERDMPEEEGFAPDGQSVAWAVCSPGCVLWWYRMQLDEFSFSNTSCNRGRRLHIVWLDDSPTLNIDPSPGRTVKCEMGKSQVLH